MAVRRQPRSGTPTAIEAGKIRPHVGSSQIGVRNRDGITPPSIAWAIWLILDNLIRMSRGGGLPWPRTAAKTMQAYANRPTPGS